MALFMDVHHDLPEGTTAADLAGAHEADVRVQTRFGVRYLNYWVDEGAGKVFCLATGPSRESVMRIHERAGHPTAEVYELPIEV